MEKFELWWNKVIGEEKPKGLYDIILGDLIKKFALKAWQECASQIKESPAIPQQSLCASGDAKLPPCCDGNICNSKNECDAWLNSTKPGAAGGKPSFYEAYKEDA